MRWNTPGGGKYYGSLSALLSKKYYVGSYSLIRHLHGMLLLGKVRKDLADAICAR